MSRKNDIQAGNGRWRWGITAKLAISFSVLFIAILAVVMVLELYGLPFTPHTGIISQQKREKFQDLCLIADMKSERLGRWLEERRDDLVVFSEGDFVRNAVSRVHAGVHDLRRGGRLSPESWDRVKKVEGYDELVDYMKLIMRTYEVYERIRIVAADSGMIFASTDETELGRNLSDLDVFKVPLQTGEVHIGDVSKDPRTGRVWLRLGNVIRGVRSDLDGVVIVNVDPDSILLPLLNVGEGLGASGEALIIDEDMRNIASLKHPFADGSRAGPLEYRIQTEPARRAVAGQKGIIESRCYCGGMVLTAYRYIPVSGDIGWGLVVKMHKAEFLAPLRRRVIYTSAAAAVGVLLILFFTLLMSRNVVRPLISLSGAAGRLAGGDLTARAEVSSTDEVGRLAGAFNAMASRLAAMQGALEEKVRERTRALTLEVAQRQKREGELEKLKGELETKVEVRTRELRERIEKSEKGRRAMLYMVEDLNKTSTELKAVQEAMERYAGQLETTNKELEAFSYSVSHDLRAPLRSMDGFSQILLEDYAERLDEEGKKHLNRIRGASQRMAGLIDDLLGLSRVTRREMKREPVSLSELAQSVATDLREAEPGRKVDFVIGPDLLVEGDFHLLRLMLEKLIENSWKFTGKNPDARIEFGATNKDGERAFFVRDDGAGFDQKYANKLFGAFQRLHSTDEFSGTGIGLATVQRIIHRHGGRVWAEATIGKGATFYFTLS